MYFWNGWNNTDFFLPNNREKYIQVYITLVVPNVGILKKKLLDGTVIRLMNAKGQYFPAVKFTFRWGLNKFSELNDANKLSLFLNGKKKAYK